MICCRNNFQEIHLDILLHFSNLDRFYRHTSKKSEVELLVVGRGGDQLGLEISYKLEPDGDLRDENNYKITQLEASETKHLYAMAAVLADEQVQKTYTILCASSDPKIPADGYGPKEKTKCRPKLWNSTANL